MMRYRLPAVLLLFCAAVVVLVWRVIPSHPKSASQSNTQPDRPAAPRASRSTVLPSSSTSNAAPASDEANAQDLGPGSSSRGVIPVPATRALAAVERPPAGPAVAPGLNPAVVLENMRSVFRQYS